EAVEALRPGLRRGGQAVEGLGHAGAVAALDDHDDVVVVAELGEVLLPALLVVLARANEVAALGVVFESGGGGVGGQRAEEEAGGQDEPGVATDDPQQAGQEAKYPGRLFRMSR